MCPVGIVVLVSKVSALRAVCDMACSTTLGNLFHATGVAFEKALSPNIHSFKEIWCIVIGLHWQLADIHDVMDFCN